MPLQLNRLPRSLRRATEQGTLHRQTASPEPTRRCRTPPAVPSVVLGYSTEAAASNLQEFSCVERFGGSFLSRRCGFREHIVVPISDVLPADFRVVVPQHTQQPKVEATKFTLDFVRRGRVNHHSAMRRVNPIALPLPKS